MREEQISDALNYLDDDIIEEADAVRQNKGNVKKKRRNWVPLAACFALIFISGYAIGKFNSSKMFDEAAESAVDEEKVEDSIADDIEENNSTIAPREASEDLAESEMMLQKNNLTIIKGTVTALSTVFSVEDDFETKHLVAEFKIESVFSGDCQEGTTISVLVPSSDLEIIWLEKENTASTIEIGTTGIFAMIESDTNIADYEFLEMTENILSTINNEN